MTIYRLILPDWATNKGLPKVLEGQFTDEEIQEYNHQGYNVYFLPNGPSHYEKGQIVDGSHVDTFNYIFVDMDLKEGKYATKQDFINKLFNENFQPSFIVDSGNGIHAYWAVTDLTAESFLRLQRRIMRKFNTDEAVCKIYQLMRVPNTLNTKDHINFKKCELIDVSHAVYTSEQMDKYLPPINKSDEDYCLRHYNQTYKIEDKSLKINDQIPIKFMHLLRDNPEVKALYSGQTDDRSKADYRLGHIMFAHGLTKEEAIAVLMNTAKASTRSVHHRINYATNIVDKIWTYELSTEKSTNSLSHSIKEILERNVDTLQGTRFPCYRYIDATETGFRLGQVIGLVAGSGVGKTAMALNMFKGFVQNNPDYDHFFIPLEQPAREIALRWKSMCGDQTWLYDKVHVISNYNDDGSFRHLSLNEIKNYILQFQKDTGKKIGCVVIDHIGALKKKTKDGENQGIMDICHEMKAFAIQTNTMLIMQSQAPREKAGIGDLELNKDAAYGTVFFESYCDYLVTIWQPFKRCYPEGAPTIMAFKFCKIRHKLQGKDEIQEDVCYRLFFDPTSQHLRELTQDEEKAFDFWNNKSTNKRKINNKTDVVTYQSTTWTKEGDLSGNRTIIDNKDKRSTEFLN